MTHKLGEHLLHAASEKKQQMDKHSENSMRSGWSASRSVDGVMSDRCLAA